MDRRTFIGTAAAALVAKPALPKESKWIDLGGGPATTEPDLFICHKTKTIAYFGDEPMKLIDLHRKLSDLWDTNEHIVYPIPTMRYTDELIETCNGYTICGNLANGTLINNREGPDISSEVKLRDWTQECRYNEEGEKTVELTYFTDEKHLYSAIHSVGRGSGS